MDVFIKHISGVHYIIFHPYHQTTFMCMDSPYPIVLPFCLVVLLFEFKYIFHIYIYILVSGEICLIVPKINACALILFPFMIIY